MEETPHTWLWPVGGATTREFSGGDRKRALARLTLIAPRRDDDDHQDNLAGDDRDLPCVWAVDALTPRESMRRLEPISRREFLPRAAGVLAGLGLAGVVGYELPHDSHDRRAPRRVDSSAGAGEVQTFLTRPDLRPPAISITTHGDQSGSPRFVFLAPRSYLPGGAGQPGLMVLDRAGRLVWFMPVSDNPFDFNAQTYKGQPVLTWWHGQLSQAHGLGVGELADSSYRTIKTVHAGDGLQADLHELNLTSAGTALVTAYEATTADLSGLGGPRNGKVFVGHAQEIDLATGKLLFDWSSIDHVGVQESYQPLPRSSKGTFDYFHIDSIAEMDDGNLLISARNTWTVYKVDRSNGQILWRMHGKKSDFTFDPGAEFYWQHCARAHGPDVVTLFDNAIRQERQSRALVLSVDTNAMHVDLTRAYAHPSGADAGVLGSVQLLPTGGVFVGWGTLPYFSEFASDGSPLLDGQMPIGVRSYRAFTHDWIGRPTDRPRIVARADPAGGFAVYASWNGATEIDRWTVLAGTTKTSLAPVGSQAWTGFETAIAVQPTGPYFAAVALDANGNELGRSETI